MWTWILNTYDYFFPANGKDRLHPAESVFVHESESSYFDLKSAITIIDHIQGSNTYATKWLQMAGEYGHIVFKVNIHTEWLSAWLMRKP